MLCRVGAGCYGGFGAGWCGGWCGVVCVSLPTNSETCGEGDDIL